MRQQQFRFQLRQILHDLNAGLLLRPAVMAACAALLSIFVTEAEARFHELSVAVQWFFPGDAGSAQVVLGTIAGSSMTVVTVVYSILIVALSLASMQFSPRILGNFMRDTINQYTFGLFIGTFTYCILVLRTTHGDPSAFVPSLSVAIAILLAIICLAALIFFIHHITQEIQANFIVDRIAEETTLIIDERFPETYTPGAEETEPPMSSDAKEVTSTLVGYLQLLDEERLFWLARENHILLQLRIAVGDFVIEGSPLVSVSPASKLTKELNDAIEGAFDFGEMRTLQQDIEFGIRQIVDIALKAISPAINDPSTAVTCLDHLGRLLGHLSKRKISSPVLRNEAKEICLLVKRPTFESCLDLAFNQIRQYGKSDMAVSLRMLRVLTQLAHVTQDLKHRQRIWYHGRLICKSLVDVFQDEDLDEFERRRDALQKLCGAKDF